MAKQSTYLSFLTGIFALTAFILMWVGGLRCNYVKFTDISGTSEPISREFGIWFYQYWSTVVSTDGVYIFKTCHSYPDIANIDPSWKAARAFDVLTIIFAIALIAMKCVEACCLDPDRVPAHKKFESPLLLLTALCQGLTLLLLSSNACTNNSLAHWGSAEFPETCEMATGAKCAISATVFWACAALTSFQERKVVEEERTAVEPVSLTEPLAGP